MFPSPLAVRIIGNLSPPDWWNIGFTGGAAILGAVIGAVIAYVVARQTARENRLALKAAQRQTEEAATLRAIVKWMELLNSIAGYHFQMERTIASGLANTGGAPVETWMVMLSLIGKPHEIRIEADELVAFTKSRKFDFLTELLSLTGDIGASSRSQRRFQNSRTILSSPRLDH